jgi:phosphatidylglycerophosphatase A
MHSLAKILATGCGCGYVPVAPGTAASLVTGILFFVLIPHPSSVLIHVFFFVILAVLFAVGVWSSTVVESGHGPDPSIVVIDEIVGMGVGLLAVPGHWAWVGAAFVLFRFFDISKWAGIDRLQNLPRGWGIMMDDLAAGVYANAIVQALILCIDPGSSLILNWN